jgi:hypothetical protein
VLERIGPMDGNFEEGSRRSNVVSQLNAIMAVVAHVTEGKPKARTGPRKARAFCQSTGAWS